MNYLPQKKTDPDQHHKENFPSFFWPKNMCSDIAKAAKILKKEGLVVFPTETVYGIGGLASSDRAVSAIYKAKGRPAYNPLIVHVDSMEQAESIATLPQKIKDLTNIFWPGPLTVVVPLKKGANIAPLACAGLKTVALRFSNHPILLALLKEVGAPLVGPSANLSGKLTSTTAAHVQKNFPDLLVLDGGATEKGVESTVVTYDKGILHILRPGAISVDEIEENTAIPILLSKETKKIVSPGQTDRHYAPNLRLRMNAWAPQKDEAFLAFGRNEHPDTTINLSTSGSLEEAAKNLFQFLHVLDNPFRYSGIAVAPIPEEGLGVTINDRLRRACKSSFS